MDKEQGEVLTFQTYRIFATLQRNILVLFEDLKHQHNNNFDKLKQNLPVSLEPVVDMSNYLDVNTYNYYRKKILDITNNGKRDLESILNDFK